MTKGDMTKAQLKAKLAEALDALKKSKARLKNERDLNLEMRNRPDVVVEKQVVRTVDSGQLKAKLVEAQVALKRAKADLKDAQIKHADLIKAQAAAPVAAKPVEKVVERVVTKGRVSDEAEIARLRAVVSRFEREAAAK